MNRYVFLFLIFCGPLQGNVMKEFISSHVPMRDDGKIDISQNFKSVKLDIGLSHNAPMSQNWLSNEKDLIVFGFEPNLAAGDSVKRRVKFLGTSFFIIPCALGLQSGGIKNFYVTVPDCGTSSLYVPKENKQIRVERVVEVPVFQLSDFFDLFPFDTYPIIDYIKIDAQGSDLDIVKSAGNYLKDRVIYITIEAENLQYENTTNSEEEIDMYMEEIGFQRDRLHNTSDPTYFNPRFSDYIKTNNVRIFQRG